MIACLPIESKEILYKNEIISTLTSNLPLFNYVTFIKNLSINEIIVNISRIRQPITSQSFLSELRCRADNSLEFFLINYLKCPVISVQRNLKYLSMIGFDDDSTEIIPSLTNLSNTLITVNWIYLWEIVISLYH